MRLQSRLPSSSTLFLVLNALAGQVTCSPLPAQNEKNALAQSNLIDFSNTPVECCQVTLSPVTLSNGSTAVQIVENCAVIVTDSCPSTQPSTQPVPTSSSPVTSLTTSDVFSTEPVSTNSPSVTPASTTVTPTVASSSSFATSTPVTTLSFSQPPSSSPALATTSSTPNASPNSSTSAIAAPKQSTALPKVIGAFAGVSIICLIIGGTIGYLKQKKLKAKVESPISWPLTR